MVEDKEEGEEASMSGSATAAARSPLPPRKRLLAGLNQNGLTSPDSASSASSVQFRKKTRNLPNFSDCHGCGSRMINKGKEKLQTLFSEWRVVLLCKKCFSGVESAKICSYCFAEMSEDGVGCCECERRVHKGCILKYKGFSPWSYSVSGSGSGLFTCIDCWVPKSLANSNGVCRSRNPDGDSKTVSGTFLDDNSRVSSAVGDSSKLLEDMVKDANFTAEKMIAAAARAREKALRKAVAARRAAEVARNALDYVVIAARQEKGVKDSLVTSTSVVDDAELAFQLHLKMNSSPRISKNLCSMNLDCLVSPKTWHCNSDLLPRESEPGSPSVCGKLEVFTDNKLFENPDRTVSEPSVRIGTSDHDSSIDMDAVEPNTKVDRRGSPQFKECQENGENDMIGKLGRGLEAGVTEMYVANGDTVELPVKEEEGTCSNKLINSSGDDNSMDSGSQSYQKQCELEHKFSSCSNGTQSQLVCDGDSSTLLKKICIEPDRYLRKYSKRRSNLKANLGCKTKFLYQDFPLESQDSVPGLPMNCSKASRAFSDASYQSQPVSLQASACESGPSRHQS